MIKIQTSPAAKEFASAAAAGQASTGGLSAAQAKLSNMMITTVCALCVAGRVGNSG